MPHVRSTFVTDLGITCDFAWFTHRLPSCEIGTADGGTGCSTKLAGYEPEPAARLQRVGDAV